MIYELQDEIFIFEPEKYVARQHECIEVTPDCVIHRACDGSVLYKSTRFSKKSLIYRVGEASFEVAFRALCAEGIPDDAYNEIRDEIVSKTRSAIIVSGCARTGTTLLLSMLGASGKVDMLEELFCFTPGPFRVRYLNSRVRPNSIWCEKTPKNVHKIDEIQRLLGDKVKIIHLIRDCRDVITSVHPSRPSEYWVPIQRWLDDTKAGVCSDAYQLRYEDLVGNPKEIAVVLEKLCNYLEIPYDERMLKQHIHGLQGSEAWFEAKAIHSQSVGKWHRPEHAAILAEYYDNEEAVHLNNDMGYD